MAVVKGGYRPERHVPSVVSAPVSSVEIEAEDQRRMCYLQSPGRVLGPWYNAVRSSGGDSS